MSKTGSALISLLMLHFETIELTAEKRGGSMKQVIHDSRARLYLRMIMLIRALSSRLIYSEGTVRTSGMKKSQYSRQGMEPAKAEAEHK